MRPGRTLLWSIVGGAVVAGAVAAALIDVSAGTPPKAASSPVAPPVSSSASPQSDRSAPVVIPTPSGTSSFAYLSDLNPSGVPGVVVRGPVTISGSIYPRSISFYCDVGDQTPFPAYTLAHDARRFQATIGLAPKSPPQFQATVILIRDGRTRRTFDVSLRKPRTVDVNVARVHTVQLECFGSGNSYTGGEAIHVVLGNARVSEGR